jgi:hypothetical protein
VKLPKAGDTARPWLVGERGCERVRQSQPGSHLQKILSRTGVIAPLKARLELARANRIATMERLSSSERIGEQVLSGVHALACADRTAWLGI